MNEKKQARAARKKRQIATIVVLCVLCVVVGRGVWGMWGTFVRAQTEATISEKELQRITERNARVSGEVAEFQDPLGREIELRKRFDVGRPGEKLLVIVEEEHPEIEEVVPITWVDRLKASLPTWLRW